MEHVKVTMSGDCILSQDNADDANLAARPMQVGDHVYLPADTFEVATKRTHNGGAYVVLCLARNKIGLSEQITPDFARKLAAVLLTSADKAEEHGRKVAAEKLTEALAKGKPA